MKRSPLRRRSPLRSHRQPPFIALPRRKAREGARLYAELRRAVHAREGGRCASCGTATPLAEGECHHRKLRSQGGPDTAWNCVWLCQSCHRAAHMAPVLAARDGWIVPSWADEHSWPCKRGGEWLQPSPDGWLPSRPPAVQAEYAHRGVVSQEVTR